MKYLCVLLTLAGSLGSALANAQIPRDRPIPHVPRWQSQHTSVVNQAALVKPLGAPRAALAANVTPVTCPEPNSVCGYVQVPLDRKQPDGPKLSIYFEQYFHSNPGPAESAIMVNLGGPGIAMVAPYRDYFQFGLFAANMDVHDLLLVDDRGRGQSGVIDCPELQHGTADFVTAEHDCAAQLGVTASRYGTGDVAEDMNEVRQALGYDLIDYLGASWGGADAIAFVTRFSEHVRSLVLDAPIGPPNVIPYTRLQSFRTHAVQAMIGNLCIRSLLCAPDHLRPDEEIEQLIDSVRDNAVEGDSHDASGNPLHVRIDEPALLDFVIRGNFTTINETLAASASLERGDAVPLLRLAAESFYTVTGDSGDPTFYSQGAFYATGCSDAGEPWEWSDPVAERIEKDNDFLADLPHDYFAPFSKSVGRDILFSALGKQCLWWEKPTPSAPIARRRATYPSVPTLVLVGDIDDTVPPAASKAVAALFPSSKFVTVANSRHETTGYTQCGTKLANQFIETLSPGDTSCANTPEYIWPAVGRFPVHARYARPAPADSSGTNRIGEAERKVVSVAVATATDSLQRFNIGSGAGVGLRGGTYSSSGTFPVFNITLANCAFSEDVIVNGTITWSFADNSMTADLIVSGPGTRGGTLHVSGAWEGLGPVGNFQVSGKLGGKNVAVLVPEG